jgi:hypothetical protein
VRGAFCGALRIERDHSPVNRLARVTQLDLAVTQPCFEGISPKLVDHDRHLSKLGDHARGALIYSVIDDMRRRHTLPAPATRNHTGMVRHPSLAE